MLKTIDLFAGAGGLSLGFQLTGEFELLAAAEISKNAKATYKANIAKDNKDFIFIDNVINCNFIKLNEELGGIDVVIGGPPCQGFSNANRQKNHLISMNNGLVKEYFRAIKEIKPKAFILENVSMLRSDTHRFYESTKDNETITALIEEGFDISKRKDNIYLADNCYDGIDLLETNSIAFEMLALPANLFQLINVLNKNLGNLGRLPIYLLKHSSEIISLIEKYDVAHEKDTNDAIDSIRAKLNKIKEALLDGKIKEEKEELEYIVSLQKLINTINEIKQNGLIGDYSITEDGSLVFTTHSYSVTDYINAILGGEYIQVGNTVNAEWCGVPQERRRYIVMGIRKDLYPYADPELPKEPDNLIVPNVGDAILDLQGYQVGYEPNYIALPYSNDDKLSPYAKEMRRNSVSVMNHITTKTTDTALERFKAIEPGKNFHSLSAEMKTSYSKPERTQNTIYLRLNPTEPSGTVVNVRKSMWIHPTLDRAITVREAARLQSFPDDFEFIGPKDSQYQQVGNAVPPLMAKKIAEQVLKCIK